MKRLLILILILLGLFSLIFYFSLGSQPKIVGEEETPPTGTALDSTIKNNPIYASYVYVKGAGYVLKDRRIVLLVGQDTAQSRQGDAIKSVEEDLESYWKWQILLGKRNIEDLTPRQNRTYAEKARGNSEEGISKKNIFSRILDVFKVADAVNVIRDTAKTCDCDDDLLLLAGSDLHLIQTTLNPDGGAVGMGPPSGSFNSDSFLKSPPQEPQTGGGKSSDSFLVGIIDSGINFGVETKQTYRTSFGGEVFITPRIQSSLNYNFMRNNTEVIDSINHGTKVARIIVKNTSSDKIRIVGLKTFDRNKVSNLYDNLCAIIYAIKHDMKVVNASWGASVKESIPVFDQVLRRAKAANMVVVCSAGNDKIDIDLNPYYPAYYADHSELGSHVITVTSKYDSVCQNFSSSGKKIDLTVKTDAKCNHPIPDAMGNMTGIFEPGTSYAAPYVTAGVINYLLLHPSGFSKSGYTGTLPAGGDIKLY